ncbi:MAG TPA: outer membrane beta-barrel protein [Vicinamibacterales bacterium]|jgi:hypothetical protein|nr:outer membrane beta-barrel protein [Vicinamibacterales bacterium]
MTRGIAILLAGWSIIGAGQALAQESITPGTVEVTLIPGGGTFYTSSNNGPSFRSYTLGGALTYNINRVVGVEGEVGGTLGLSQDLQFGGGNATRMSPSQLSYTGNMVVSAPTRSPLVPYVTGGVGGLTTFERAELGINSTETFLTGNVGGGVKWYAPSGIWGLRGDYRFTAVRANDGAPAFFGIDTRYGHRVYGGVVINVVR